MSLWPVKPCDGAIEALAPVWIQCSNHAFVCYRNTCRRRWRLVLLLWHCRTQNAAAYALTHEVFEICWSTVHGCQVRTCTASADSSQQHLYAFKAYRKRSGPKCQMFFPGECQAHDGFQEQLHAEKFGRAWPSSYTLLHLKALLQDFQTCISQVMGCILPEMWLGNGFQQHGG